MQPAMNTINIHSHTRTDKHAWIQGTFACMYVCVCLCLFCCYHLPFHYLARRQGKLYKGEGKGKWGRCYSRCRVLGHNLFSIRHRFLHLHFHVRVVRGFLAFAVANLNDVFHPHQQLSKICNSFYALFCLTLFALRQQFVFRIFLCVHFVFSARHRKITLALR